MKEKRLSSIILIFGLFIVLTMPVIVFASSEIVYNEFTKTVTVSPSPGGDDTANIQMAFDWAVVQGSGSTVKLTAGQFNCESIHVENFYGTFSGAGKSLTTIDIIPGGAEIIDYFDGAQISYFFYFRGGDVSFSDMQFHITSENPSDPWNWFDGPKTAVSIIYVDGPTESVQFNRVGFKGGFGDWYGRNVVVAILPWSVDIFNYVEVGSIVVNDCTFESLETALNLERVSHSDVEMTHCTTTDVDFGVLNYDNFDVNFEMKDNVIDCTLYGMYIVYHVGSIEIADNSFSNFWDIGLYFAFVDGKVEIIDNSIHSNDAWAPVLGQRAENILFSNNFVTGYYVYGINPYLESNGWKIEKNTFGKTKDGTIVGITSWYGVVAVELSSDCIVRKNQFFDVTTYLGVVYIWGNDNSIINNDYTQSNLLGWNSGIGCILLDFDTQNNLVVEGLSPTGSSFPLGTSLCDQVLDIPRWYEGDSTNLVAGYAACEYNPNWDRIVEMLMEKLENTRY